MQPAKGFGLLLSAMLALLALGSVSSASATVLCQMEGETYCAKETTLPTGTALNASLAKETEAVFTSSLGSVKCKKSTLEGKTTAEEAEPLPGTVSAFSFSECKLSETSCTVTTENLPYNAELTYTEEGDGTLLITSGGKGSPATKLVCGFFISCKVSNKSNLQFEGGEPGAIIASEQPLTTEGALCPKKVTFTATYAIGKPEGVFVAKQQPLPPTKLCTGIPAEVGGVLICPGGTEYSGETVSELEAGNQGTFTSIVGPNGTISCNEVTAAGGFNSTGFPQNPGGLLVFSFGNNHGACTSTLNGTPNVTVQFKNIPFTATYIFYISTTEPQGSMGIGGLNGFPELKLTVERGGGNVICEYTRNDLYAHITNGSATVESKLGFLGYWARSVESPAEGVCPSRMSQIARLKFLTPGNANVYLAAG